jgi:hypothetical protein
MGAYLAIYPFNTIRVLVGPFGVVKAPAVVICALWFAWE